MSDRHKESHQCCCLPWVFGWFQADSNNIDLDTVSDKIKT